ncbi:MAG: NACHT domain-containing protein, partial [Chloroflexia bacterium]|nr:NACHT domain-containing protein [Chloroflexia bacterium]
MSKDLDPLQQELANLEQMIASLESQRATLGEVVVEAALAGLQAKRDALQAQMTSRTLASGMRGVAISGNASHTTIQTGDTRSEGGYFADPVSISGGHLAVRDQTVFEGDMERTVVITGDGAQLVIGELPIETPQVDPGSALEHYLRYVISRNRYLQHQGIRSGGKLVQVELERIYIRLRASRQRTVEAREEWLEGEAEMAPGEPLGRRGQETPPAETVTVSVEEALAEHPQLVVLGDPGSGKTTLLRYLALLYARDLAEGSNLVSERLGLEESGYLPILLPLRRLGAYLKAHHGVEDGVEGHALLLEHFEQMLAGERIELPRGFFDAYLKVGRAVVLLDGLDEVAGADLRRRVSRLVEAFTSAYSDCRYVVSSRIVGYKGPARLGESYALTTIRDFTLADVEQFLCNWHLAVAVGQLGPGPSAQVYAEQQTAQLMEAIRGSERIRELAINPLMLTVIALVHRDRVKLPDRRAELYDEAVEVLLGKWEEAKGLRETPILDDSSFDAGDKRLL